MDIQIDKVCMYSLVGITRIKHSKFNLYSVSIKMVICSQNTEIICKWVFDILFLWCDMLQHFASYCVIIYVNSFYELTERLHGIFVVKID